MVLLDQLVSFCHLVPLSYVESKLIPVVSWQDLRHLIGQRCTVSALHPVLTGSRGEYFRVVGIHSDG